MISRLGAGLIFAAALAGCALVGENSDTSEAAATAGSDLDELKSLVGDDRVGRTVVAHPDAMPNDLPAAEDLFAIGRKCARTDSKEIWTASENSSRLSGAQIKETSILPRLVIGGCNQNPSTTSLRDTFSLFVATVSDDTRPVNDALNMSPVEMMALDDTTGLFNFYVFEKNVDPTKGASLTRFVRRTDDVIEKWVKLAGQPVTREVTEDRRCYNCHISGSPVMNEMTDPWTHWVSSRNTYNQPITGNSATLVTESRPLHGEHNRSSLSNELEKVMRSAISQWVEGVAGRPASGLGPQTLAGKSPGGLPRLLKSVFCETEVNYAAAFDTVPTPIFVDQAIADTAAIGAPAAPANHDLTLIPVRSETDIRIEKFLEKKGILTPDAVLAVRLVDEMNDIFSAPRCSLLPKVLTKIDAGATPDAATRAAVEETLATATAGPRSTFMHALLDQNVSEDARDQAAQAYTTDITARVGDEFAKLQSSAGLAELSQRKLTRQASARAMFPDNKNPLPITE